MRRPVAEASHAPGVLYASPDVYRLEVERLFRRDWLLVGREEEPPARRRIDIERYVVVHDCGRVINPMIVEGRSTAAAQGIGQVVLEAMV